MINILLLLCTFCRPVYSKSAPNINYEAKDTYESPHASYESGGASYSSCNECYK